MNIQLTNYGIKLLNNTQSPLKIDRYVLGSSFDYVPQKDATGIKGVQVYENTMPSHTVVNANVYKYSIGLDYQVGPFKFGEIAYFVEGGCVAVAVSETLISKPSLTNNSGVSMRIDTYLSMVGDQYSMWNDSIGSDIDYQVPVLSSIDSIPPVHESDPNMYLISAPSSNMTSMLAYSASNGIWNFDAYAFSNTSGLTVLEATSSSVTVDISGLSTEQRAELNPSFFGDKVLEFVSGSCLSICRIVYTVTHFDTKALLTFRTPLATLPEAGDNIYIFSRTQVSVSTIMLPIATKDALGGVIVGEGLEVDSSGRLTPIFPVESVNGYIGEVNLTANDIEGLALVATTGSYKDLKDTPVDYRLPIATQTVLGGVKVGPSLSVQTDGTLGLGVNPILTINNASPDANGNIELDIPTIDTTGLINPVQLANGVDLDTLTDIGLFYAPESVAPTVTNSPTTDAFTLEILSNDTGIVQRLSTGTQMWIRLGTQGWTFWSQLLSDIDLPVATKNSTGVISVGDGLKVDDYGKLSANVVSFNQRSGAITLTYDDVNDALKADYDVAGGFARLTPDVSGTEDVYTGRITWRRSANGAFIDMGTWDCVANSINNDPLQKLADGGVVTYLTDADAELEEERYSTWAPNGFVLRVNRPEGVPTTVDGITPRHNDYLVSLNGRWRTLFYDNSFLVSTRDKGLVVGVGNATPVARSVVGTDDTVITNGNGQDGDIVVGLSTTGVTAGTYSQVTVDDKGRITAGTEVEMPADAPKSTILYYNGTKWVALAPGGNGSVLALDENGDLTWTNTVPNLIVTGTLNAKGTTK